MEALFSRANKKFIDHLAKANELYAKYGDEALASDEFKQLTTVSDNNNIDDILMFYFVVGFELRDMNPETVTDPSGKILETLDLLKNLSDVLDDCPDRAQLYNLACCFFHKYFVMNKQKDWITYSKNESVTGSKLTQKIIESFEHLRCAMEYSSKVKPDGNQVFNYYKDSEMDHSVKSLRGHFVEGRNPDYSALYIFSDQLGDAEFWKGFASIIAREVNKELTFGK